MQEEEERKKEEEQRERNYDEKRRQKQDEIQHEGKRLAKENEVDLHYTVHVSSAFSAQTCMIISLIKKHIGYNFRTFIFHI